MHCIFPAPLITSIRDAAPADEIELSRLADKLWAEAFGRRHGHSRELAWRLAAIAFTGSQTITSDETRPIDKPGNALHSRR